MLPGNVRGREETGTLRFIPENQKLGISLQNHCWHFVSEGSGLRKTPAIPFPLDSLY